ncbi:MAG: hypothetical protein GX591_13065, partial [Planctomycetes bacterium]|nr:hypothetical protein [Planctomycetota bacterium]
PRFDLYSIYVAEGDRLCAIMTSTAFDAYLVLLSPSGRTWEDDDSGGGRSAMLEVQADTTGVCILAACSYGQGLGPYQLRITCPSGTHWEGTAVPLPRHVPSAVEAQPVQLGRLDETDARLRDNTCYDCYVFNAAAGDRITVSMTSATLDAFLAVRSPSGAIESDDDSGVGTNAFILIPAADATGQWCVFANSIGPVRTGDYELRVSVQPTEVSPPRPAPSPPVPNRLQAGGAGTTP